jgi:hypothetical protein
MKSGIVNIVRLWARKYATDFEFFAFRFYIFPDFTDFNFGSQIPIRTQTQLILHALKHYFS